MDLLKRRQAVLDANIKATKTRGSGWHPADDGSKAREDANQLPLEQRPIVLQDDDQMHVCGPCVALIQTAAKKVLEVAKADLKIWHTEPYTSKVVKAAQKALACKDEIVMNSQEWNYLNHGLMHIGCQCCCAAASG